MHGNVREWCRDAFTEEAPSGRDLNHSEKDAKRVIRGGCWNDSAWFGRSASRHRRDPWSCANDLGFRVVLSVVPQSRPIGNSSRNDKWRKRFEMP